VKAPASPTPGPRRFLLCDRTRTVLEVLCRVARGEERHSIARATGHGRATVDRYAKTAVALGWVPGDSAPDEALAREVVEQLRPGPKHRPPGSTRSKLALLQGRIRAWLAPEDDSRGLQISKVRRTQLFSLVP